MLSGGDLIDTSSDDMDSLHIAQDRDQRLFLVNTIMETRVSSEARNVNLTL